MYILKFFQSNVIRLGVALNCTGSLRSESSVSIKKKVCYSTLFAQLSLHNVHMFMLLSEQQRQNPKSCLRTIALKTVCC